MKHNELTTAAELVWKRSSHSGNNGNCVEVAHLVSGVDLGVRDSKNIEGGALSFSREQWTAFVEFVKPE
ncbi:DUF397 domain-containing protein [Streptomyces sp. NPDC020379]|uniref:DUF397 domain-containing protein n=1 Tax=Streptomyces sp. NPDC020379 TaxID=3365071 RepID=UPI0037970F78